MIGNISKTFSKEQFKCRRIYRLAEVIYDHWESGYGMNTELFQRPFIPDEIVLRGESIKGGSYREHIVPRVVLRDQCMRKFDAGDSVEDIKDALIQHLGIVTITREEADRLNQEFKTTMPPGWAFPHGNPFERLEYVGIELKPDSMEP